MRNLFSLLILLTIQTCAFGQFYKDWETFECNQGCKSDLIFKIRYPSGWIAEDPDHYGLIKKFRPKNVNGPGFVISITDNKVKLSDKEIKEVYSKESHYETLKFYLNKISNKYEIISERNLFIEGNLAIVSDYIYETSKMDGQETRICRDYNFMFEKYIITMQASITYGGSLADGQDILKNMMKEYGDIFNKIANSIVIKRN